MNDNKLYPACTFIVGLPQETEDDVLRRRSTSSTTSGTSRRLLVPMFFVPLGHLKSRDWFRRDRLSRLQEELLKRALTHGVRQSKVMLNDFFDWEGGAHAALPGRLPGVHRLPRDAGAHERALEPRAAAGARDDRPELDARTGCRSRPSPCGSRPVRSGLVGREFRRRPVPVGSVDRPWTVLGRTKVARDTRGAPRPDDLQRRLAIPVPVVDAPGARR